MRRSIACREYLHLHYGEPITLATLAQVAGISPSRLAHLFAELMGTSPMRYPRQLRMRKAEQPAAHYRFPRVAAVAAAACGSDDPFDFSRIFKCATGASPSSARGHGTTRRRESAQGTTIPFKYPSGLFSSVWNACWIFSRAKVCEMRGATWNTPLFKAYPSRRRLSQVSGKMLG